MNRMKSIFVGLIAAVTLTAGMSIAAGPMAPYTNTPTIAPKNGLIVPEFSHNGPRTVP
jgi:hypothetical protein